MAKHEEKKDKPSQDEFVPPGSTPDTGTPLPTDSDDSMLDFGVVASIREGASGVIPLAELPDPQSSPSLISWTEVIRQHRETQSTQDSGYDQPVKIDSVSDKDLLKRIVAEEMERAQAPAIPAEKRDTDKLGQVPIVVEEEGAVIELSELDDWQPPQPPSGSAVRFDVANPPSDAGGAMPMPWEDEELLEAIPIDDDLADDDIPLAELVPEDEEFPEHPPAHGAFADAVANWPESPSHDQDDITAMPVEEAGFVAGHSSILDILLRESDPGHSRSASGIVDLAGKPGSGVLSSISSLSPVKKSDSDNVVIADTLPPEIAPGNSWMRDVAMHAGPVSDPDTTETIGALWEESNAVPPVQTNEGWVVEDAVAALPIDDPLQTEQTLQPIEASDTWATDHLAEVMPAESEWLIDAAPGESLTELTVEEALEVEMAAEAVLDEPIMELPVEEMIELTVEEAMEVELAAEAVLDEPIMEMPVEVMIELTVEEAMEVELAAEAVLDEPIMEMPVEEMIELTVEEALEVEMAAEAVLDEPIMELPADEAMEVEDEPMLTEMFEGEPVEIDELHIDFMAVEAVPLGDEWLSGDAGTVPQQVAPSIEMPAEEVLEAEMAEALPEEDDYSSPVAPQPDLQSNWLSGDSGKTKETTASFHVPAEKMDDEFDQPLPVASDWLIGDEDEAEQPLSSFEAAADSATEDDFDKPLPRGSDWLSDDATPNRRTMSSFQLPDDNPEEAVDLYAEGPFNSAITDSGSLQVSDEQMEEAARKQRLSESSAIDLSSKASSVFNLDLESAKALEAIPVEEMVDMSLPPGAVDDSSMIRRFEDIAPDEHLQYSDRHKTPDAPIETPVVDEEPMFAEASPVDEEPMFADAPAIDEDAAAAFFDETEETPAFAEDPPSSKRGRHQRDSSAFPDETTEYAANEPPAEMAETAEMAVVDSFVEEEAAASPPVQPAKPVKPEQPRRKRGGLLTGALFGIVLGGGGLFAANYFEVLPDAKSVVEQTGLVVKKEDGVKPPGNLKPNPLPVAGDPPTPTAGRQMLEAGNLAKAVAILDACDANSPETLAGRGQAKWLLYLQKSAEEGKSLNREDPAVAVALADLKSATEKAKGNDKAEADAARAYLWLGLIDEALEDYTAAETNYTKAEAELKDPANKALIQNAKNRLQVIRPAQGNLPLSAIPPEHLMLAFVMLLAPEPDGTPDAKEPAGQECGFLFWEALLLASKQEYRQAADKIAQIKAVHARQQIKMAGRGLNPRSDPREQLLPVSLDELGRYWQLCDQIYKRPEAKMLVEQKKTVEALAAILAKSKESEDAIKTIVDKLKLKPEDKPADAVETLLADKKKAEDDKTKVEDAKKLVDDMLAAVGKTLKDAGIDEPKVEDGLKKLAAGKADADTKIKNLAEALDKAGIKEPDTAKALAMLILSRDDAETIVQGLRERFLKAKYINADATKEMVFKAIDEAITHGAADALVKLSQEKKDAEAKAAKLEVETDKTKKDAEAIVKKTKDDADASIKKTNEDADAQIKKTEKAAAEQKEMYETRIANSAKDYIGAAGKSEGLLKEGRYDAALKEYFNGLKSLKVLPKEQEDLLERIIATHPATVKLDTTAPDAGQALKHYGAGLELFNAGRYDNAEQEFAQAVAFDSKDARYRYFLGLARWQQNKRGAATEDFKAGAALESQSLPAPRVVNSSLERIQGPTRAVIESYRP